MKKVSDLRFFKLIILLGVLAVAGYFGYDLFSRYKHENYVLKQIVSRLEADSRAAEVLVTNVRYDEKNQKTYTTIKFLEYDSKGKPMEAKYFTFSGNIIQFQTLIVRFDDIHIRRGDALKGKSAYLFWKVFMLDGTNTQEYDITQAHTIPDGYKLADGDYPLEKRLWQQFWEYALNPQKAKKVGIKNAQIEAPGTMFVPGILYTIKIEHDGGLRIDALRLPPILKGETIPE
ncbi:MAG TPA: hypothetical protein VI749_07320 [Candidatus Omnitrophota bacterium]|nr:hypothetical protein [Candidatus Omnitrophota bacterium]